MAFLLDSLLYGLLMAVIVLISVVLGAAAFADCSWVDVAGGATDLACPPGSPSTGLLLAAVGVGVIGVLAVALMYLTALGRTGQSWGKRIVGIKVVRVQAGSPPGFWRAVGRELFAVVISSNILYLGFLWMLWDGDRQTWHDKIAGTVVIKV